MLLRKSFLKPDQTIQICGSKSVSNRLLIVNALFSNIKIENISDSEDTALLSKALKNEHEIIDIQHAGTAMRFLTAYYAMQENKTVVLTGSDRMKQRPIGHLVDALKCLGADIHYLKHEGFPPLKIFGKKISRSAVEVPANVSSQFITALMLIGAALENGIRIKLRGKITSKSYIDLTVSVLKKCGIQVKFEEDKIVIKHLRLNEKLSQSLHYHVESDWSSASYFYSLAALGHEKISLKNFRSHSEQGDSILKQVYWDCFGINTISDNQEYTIVLSKEPKSLPDRITLDLNSAPDIAQTVCVTAASLKIPFEISGLETLKIKETDRLSALRNELEKIGCKVEITLDSIKTVEFCEPVHPVVINTYNDHRMAMSFAPYCLINEIKIENPEVVQKSYPTFWDDLSSILTDEKS